MKFPRFSLLNIIYLERSSDTHFAVNQEKKAFLVYPGNEILAQQLQIIVKKKHKTRQIAIKKNSLEYL